MSSSADPATISVTLSAIAKAIDHSLLHPTLTDSEIARGLQVAATRGVATACVKPYSVAGAAAALAGTGVGVCAVVGFPHGGHTTACKAGEAAELMRAGAGEIDVVVNVGKVLSGEWAYVGDEIAAVQRAMEEAGGGQGGERPVLKVIFENDFLQDEHIVRLCQICTELRVDYVKTSTGFGFVKRAEGEGGGYTYRGATPAHLKLMRQSCGPDVKIKAAGGVRTLDQALYVMALGVSRIGATATEAILDEAKARGISEEPTVVAVKAMDG